jgi:hypothetical protein
MSVLDFPTADRYAAIMAAYSDSLSSLLARLDGCLPVASAPDDTVKPASCRPDRNQGDR